MLESLRQGAGNIHQLNLEGAFPEPAEYRPREAYEELKRTPLYDAQHGQWNWSMSEEQEVKDTARLAYAQLLGVLLETQFNPEEAHALYKGLKASPLYDADRGQWNQYIYEEQQDTVRTAYSQLLGVLVETQFNPQGARTLYEELKTTPLYDAARGLWNGGMSEEAELGITDRYTLDQLIGVLVEAQFNPQGARTLYEELKTTPLYDATRGQWKWKPWNVSRYADVQLLGVLVEAHFDPEGARALYDKLKATPLYDAARGQWNLYISEEQELENTNRTADAQLLGVLVDAKLLSTLPRPLSEAIPPLPITEDW